MLSLCHYTLETGDIRRSPRSEVGDDIIERLRPLLATGTHAVPFGDHTVRVTTDRSALLATVFHGKIPLVTFGVAPDAAALTALRSAMRLPAGADVWTPACLVHAEKTIVLAALEGADLGWLGDFERCVAWAWIERSRPC